MSKKSIGISHHTDNAERIFVIGYSLFIVANVLSWTIWTYSGYGETTGFSVLVQALRYGSFVILCCCPLLKKVKKRIFIDGVIPAGVCVISVICSRSYTPILYAGVFLASLYVSGRLIIKITLFFQSTILFSVTILSQIGVVEDYIWVDAIRTRHFLGFAWASVGSFLFLFIIWEYIYIRYRKISVIEYLIMLGLSMYFYKMTASRIPFILSIVSLAFFFLTDKITLKKRNHMALKWSFVAPEVCAIVAIVFHAFYDASNEFYCNANALLSQRLSLGYQAIQDYGMTLFGQPISWIGWAVSTKTQANDENYNYVDCSYLQILLQYGIVFLVLILLFYSLMMHRAYIEKDRALIYISVFTCILAMVEPKLLDLTFNPFPLLAISGLYKRHCYDKLKYVRHNGEMCRLNA